MEAAYLWCIKQHNTLPYRAGALITLNINEADEATRTNHKLDLGEKYRTLLGHFRHEVGHYYWAVTPRASTSTTAQCSALYILLNARKW